MDKNIVKNMLVCVIMSVRVFISIIDTVTKRFFVKYEL